MASAIRPSAQRALMAASTRSFASAGASAVPMFRFQLSRQSRIVQRAAFQTSARRALLPALPQVVEGTVNDPVKVKDSSPSHGSYHWTAERVVSVALIPITIAPFAAGSLSPLMDGAFIGLLLVHSHIGFQSSITDYLPTWRVPRLRKFFEWGLNLALLVVGWGWYEFETNDVGFTEMIKRLWLA